MTFSITLRKPPGAGDIKGMEVVQAIEAVKTTVRSGYGDVPVEPVIIKKVSLLEPQK